MKITDDKPEFTKNEASVVAARDLLRSGKVDVRESAREALDTMTVKPTKAFVEYLSKGTLTLDHGEVVDSEVPETASV